MMKFVVVALMCVGISQGQSGDESLDQSPGQDNEVTDFDIAAFVNDQCGVDLSQLEQAEAQRVSPQEVSTALDAMTSYVATAAQTLTSNKTELGTAVDELGDADLPTILSHSAMFDRFGDALKRVAGGGVCTFVNLYIIAKRLEFAGPNDEFEEESCSATREDLQRFSEMNGGSEPAMVAAVASDVTVVRAIAEAVTSDMACVMRDVEAYDELSRTIGAAASSSPSVSQVLVAVASLDAAGSLLVRRMVGLSLAVEQVVSLIDQAAELRTQPAEPSNELVTTLTKLNTLLRKMGRV